MALHKAWAAGQGGMGQVCEHVPGLALEVRGRSFEPRLLLMFVARLYS